MKSRSEYVCQQCGYKSPSFLGKCPNCGEWNSLVETLLRPSTLLRTTEGQANLQLENNLFKLSEVKSQHFPRISTGFLELDRVLGGGPASPDSPRSGGAGERASRGGIVPGSIVLIAGEPGIGKSTLLLQAAMQVAEGASNKLKVNSNSVLYVTGEESAHQVKIRADRIGKVADSLYILPITEVEGILAASEKVDPKLIIVDSIQTLTTSALSGAAGSVGQVRECAQILQRQAKVTHIPIFLVGHVTKEGTVAGPKVLEHLVDAVLNLEGDGMHVFRILRSIKNRFGSTFEVGVFEMTDEGMVEVTNPSKIFLEQRVGSKAGSVVAPTITGERSILAEVQALCNSPLYGVPVRKATGLDFSRVQIVIASLAKMANLPLANLDIYVNVAGGLKLTEPAVDLAVALAIASSALNKPVKDRLCAFGEVGLLGELRPVSHAKNRMAEAKRLGFNDFVSSERFRTLQEAIGYAIQLERK